MVEIKINVKASNDQKYEVSVEPSATVTQLKQILAEKCDTPVERQRLIYSGRVLKDSETVESYKIAEGHTLHLVRGAANPATTTSAAPTATTPSVQPQVPLNPAAPNVFGEGNPLAALAGLGGFGGMGGMGNMGGMGGMGNMGGMEGFGGMDPNMMNGLLQNPMFLQSMSAMMANPQMMDVMIAMNPQLASVITPEFRTMMQSPEFRQMMSDPATLQMMAQLGGMGGMGGNLLGTLGVPNAGTSPVSPNPATTVPNPTPTTPVNSFGVPGLGNSNANSAAAQMALLQQMFAAGGGGGGMGMFGAPNSAPGQPQQPPEERFATQIQQLNDMGFWDAQSNVRALTATNGNVNGAVEWLLSNPM